MDKKLFKMVNLKWFVLFFLTNKIVDYWLNLSIFIVVKNNFITIIGDVVQLAWDDMWVSSYNIYRSNDP